MGTKRYVVREGFNFRMVDQKGNEKVYSEGDPVTLEQEVGDAAHQLQYADEKDRAAALKLEQEARRTVVKSESNIAASVAAIDHDALGEAIAQGIARAFAAMQPKAEDESTDQTGNPADKQA